MNGVQDAAAETVQAITQAEAISAGKLREIFTAVTLPIAY